MIPAKTRTVMRDAGDGDGQEKAGQEPADRVGEPPMTASSRLDAGACRIIPAAVETISAGIW